MVRLKDEYSVAIVGIFSIFQFQNGTIKSADKIAGIDTVAVFQFQNGTIKSKKG